MVKCYRICWGVLILLTACNPRVQVVDQAKPVHTSSLGLLGRVLGVVAIFQTQAFATSGEEGVLPNNSSDLVMPSGLFSPSDMSVGSWGEGELEPYFLDVALRPEAWGDTFIEYVEWVMQNAALVGGILAGAYLARSCTSFSAVWNYNFSCCSACARFCCCDSCRPETITCIESSCCAFCPVLYVCCSIGRPDAQDPPRKYRLNYPGKFCMAIPCCWWEVASGAFMLTHNSPCCCCCPCFKCGALGGRMCFKAEESMPYYTGRSTAIKVGSTTGSRRGTISYVNEDLPLEVRNDIL